MSEDNLQLLASGKSSDFTITCQDVKFKVHQAIICPESSIFQAACTNNSKGRRKAAKATLSLPEEDPEILARVLIWLYTRDVYRPHIKEETEKTLAKLVPEGPTTERSEFETCVLVYFCADRQGIECVKRGLAKNIGSLIRRFKEGDVDGDFSAFVETVYNDIPAKDDPLRTKARYSDDDNDEDAPKRIQALIRANEPAAWELATDTISMFKGWR